MTAIETDYLVVGAGLAGLAFTDSLVEHSAHDVVLVDRRHSVGGHWLDAYPFVRLHQPSAHYGVNSMTLGNDAIDTEGPNAGGYECALGVEVVAYFERVLRERLLPTGRVRFLGMHDYVPGQDGGAHRLVSRLSGETTEVTVRRKLVDATYFETKVPATHPATFPVAPGVPLVPVGGLTAVREAYDRYVVLGGGKTGIDAVLWLLGNGLPPDRITWVRPRDAWLIDRESFQPLDLVARAMEGLALDLEAAAGAESLPDLYRRLEERRRLLRIDPDVEPTMFHCATVNAWELDRLRSVRDVVRLGHVTRIDADGMVLTGGTVPATGRCLYVDCTTRGLTLRPPKPVFEPGKVTVQQVRQCAPSFNSALIGYVEATRDDVAEQNRLCPPNPYANVPRDWARMLVGSMTAFRRWQQASDIVQWVEASRLNFLRGLADHAEEPRLQRAFATFGANLGPGLTRLTELLAASEPDPAREPAAATAG